MDEWLTDQIKAQLVPQQLQWEIVPPEFAGRPGRGLFLRYSFLLGISGTIVGTALGLLSLAIYITLLPLLNHKAKYVEYTHLSLPLQLLKSNYTLQNLHHN